MILDGNDERQKVMEQTLTQFGFRTIHLKQCIFCGLITNDIEHIVDNHGNKCKFKS
jgi:hypothetical protein